MNFVIDKIISKPACTLAVSPDGTRIAVSGERVINIFSYPDLQPMGKTQAPHPCSMVFLSDSQSLLILTTTGRTFLWNGVSAKPLGKWPVPQCQSSPMFHCVDDRIAWAGYGGIWMYYVKGREIRNIFPSQRDVRICRCDEGTIRCVAMDYGEAAKAVDLLTLTYEGAIRQQAQSEIQVKNCFSFDPAWSDEGLIAISTSIRRNFPLKIIYLLNTEGQVAAQEWIPPDEDNGNFYVGSDMFAKVSAVANRNINFYNAHNLEPVFRMDRQKLAAYGMTAPPTFVWFAPDNRVLVGSWSELLVFRMVL